MAMDIPASSRIPQEWEVSFDLKVLKDLMGLTEDLLADIIFEDESTIKKAMGQRNKDIEINLLYKLYFFANEHWLANWNKETKNQIDVDKVTCTRRLRDACKKEISRRTML